jgi:shikimate dehydrogenase
MARDYFVIGKPIRHSLSPDIHNALYDIYGMAGCRYSRLEVDAESLPCFIEYVNKNDVGGFNVTMPLKNKIGAYLDRDFSNGSVNTVIKKEDGRLYGYSTDARGFFAALQTGAQGTRVKT